ncbi:MAG: hypothetical protein Q4F27_01845 [Desulfovibrionaceae bacterium]|nr:hypothetical protein [Desulfovibrionaceae bacterium]
MTLSFLGSEILGKSGEPTPSMLHGYKKLVESGILTGVPECLSLDDFTCIRLFRAAAGAMPANALPAETALLPYEQFKLLLQGNFGCDICVPTSLLTLLKSGEVRFHGQALPLP